MRTRLSPRPVENRHLDLPKPMPRTLRPYHYLRVAERDRENPHVVRELVRCGKPSCSCAKDVRRRHGPYWYLRFEEFDRRTGQTRYRREYVPERELGRVRRWIRRSRAASARGRAVLSLLRRCVTGMEARARRRSLDPR
jgi:uncharacterized protein DUF6788